ncbi:MAG: hypothetical protein IJR92_02555 [Alphaproteobacteria bacterium]|nr:hypothetical protein [Alphaproteobacteria bacterium]
MKKLLACAVVLAGLSGCTYYDYYKGGVRYTQDGADCVYYSGEYARHYSYDINGMDGNKRIVYRNTRCEDLFARDNGGRAPRPERQILAPAYQEAPVVEQSCPYAAKQVAEKPCGCGAAPVVKSCGCNATPVSRRVYTVTVM